jgi:hypothetical protein
MEGNELGTLPITRLFPYSRLFFRRFKGISEAEPELLVEVKVRVGGEQASSLMVWKIATVAELFHSAGVNPEDCMLIVRRQHDEKIRHRNRAVSFERVSMMIC